MLSVVMMEIVVELPFLSLRLLVIVTSLLKKLESTPTESFRRGCISLCATSVTSVSPWLPFNIKRKSHPKAALKRILSGLVHRSPQGRTLLRNCFGGRRWRVSESNPCQTASRRQGRPSRLHRDALAFLFKIKKATRRRL
jgi:hypothetical protein